MSSVAGLPALSYAPEIQAKGITSITRDAAQPGGVSFSDRLAGAMKSVEASQNHADLQLQAVAAGRDVDLHAAMIALEEADISLRAMTSVRDKCVESYERIMNMSI
ncbi:MAG: flagellar hook-basal body complex protein FliE [Myxococcota bacterium]|jgi:flagellar hook-basal body complex protein FliE